MLYHPPEPPLEFGSNPEARGFQLLQPSAFPSRLRRRELEKGVPQEGCTRNGMK